MFRDSEMKRYKTIRKHHDDNLKGTKGKMPNRINFLRWAQDFISTVAIRDFEYKHNAVIWKSRTFFKKIVQSEHIKSINCFQRVMPRVQCTSVASQMLAFEMCDDNNVTVIWWLWSLVCRRRGAVEVLISKWISKASTGKESSPSL